MRALAPTRAEVFRATVLLGVVVFLRDPLVALPFVTLALVLLAGRLRRAAAAALLTGIVLAVFGFSVPASERPAHHSRGAGHGANTRNR